jgi:hypothetical protein
MTRSPASCEPRQELWTALRLPFVLGLCALGLWGQALWTSPALASDTNSDSQVLPSTQEVEEALPEGGTLSGREIYERFLDNKYRRSVQRMRVVSRDPGGSEQTTTFKVSLEDFRNEQEEPTDGVVAKMLVEVSAPFDMRNTSYLMISKDPGPDDEFIYQPSERRVRRFALKKIPLMGTDYTFDDIAYHDIEHADYARMPDEEIDGTLVYVVESMIKETRDVEYHRTLTYVEKDHYVPLRIRYWDEFGVEIKEMRASQSSLKAFDDVWIATESTMHDLLQGTSSTLHVDSLKTEPSFSPKLFTLARLTQGL